MSISIQQWDLAKRNAEYTLDEYHGLSDDIGGFSVSIIEGYLERYRKGERTPQLFEELTKVE